MALPRSAIDGLPTGDIEKADVVIINVDRRNGIRIIMVCFEQEINELMKRNQEVR
jgi:hypothetical protein